MNLNERPVRTGMSVLAIFFVACAAPSLRASSVTQVTIDTSTLAGQTENLVFDFDLGGGTQSNTVSITNFFTDGTLSPIYQTHGAGVTGYLPADLTFTTGTALVEELYVTETLGNTISFDFDSTNNAPTADAFPDEFDVYLLGPASFETALPSTDPSGAGSLLAIDLAGYSGPSFSNFSENGEVTLAAPAANPTGAPEPGGLLLFGLAMLAAGSRPCRLGLLRLRRSPLLTPNTLRIPAAVLVLVFAFVPGLRAQTAVTGVGIDSNFAVAFSGLRSLHSANTVVSVATIFNASPQTITGPFYLGISGSGGPVYLLNASGQMPDGTSGYAISTPATLGPGQSASVTVPFSDPSNKTFTITAKVWDAASNPPPPMLQCPQGVTAPGLGDSIVASYNTPVDSLGRPASCVPTPGTSITTYNPTGTCSSAGGYSPAASCSFTVTTPNLSTPIVISGTFTVEYPTETTIAIIPCSSLAGNFSPAQVTSLPLNYPLYYACGVDAVGTTSYSVYNYGPTPARNFSVTMKFPPGASQAGWRFSLANNCAPPVPQSFSVTLPGVPTVTVPNGEDITCTFAELDPYQAMSSDIGLNVLSGGSSTSVPAIELDLALDPTQNFTKDTSEMSARVTVSAGIQSITVPASVSVKSQPCDYSNSPGFAILLNTCGVPPLVNQILVGAFAGAVTVVTGGAGAFLDITDFLGNSIFNADQGGLLLLTR